MFVKGGAHIDASDMTKCIEFSIEECDSLPLHNVIIFSL